MVKNAIKVYARLKPEKNRKNIMNYQIRHRPKEKLEEDFLFLVVPSQKTKEYPDNRPESWNFSFFRIFEESTTQEDVFKNVARPVVESALDGYNGTIFAYGQTASGKTYSITGKQESSETLGIIPRSLLYLFEAIQKRPENVYSVEVAYLEIYNENGYDLLDRRQQRDNPVTRLEDLPRVAVQEDEIGRLHMKNLTFHCVGSAEDAFELLLVGDSNRVTIETPMNPESSRSHCIFTIVVCTKKFGADEYKRAKVHLVDLAGSERVYKCSISGTILTEAKHINLSLHYLEQVIVCLGQESTGHIPYRNSLLTSILRDSLGGNCLTTMLATISVESYNLQETVSTCKFAQRVALIRNDVKVVLEKDVHSENALLRLENEKLRQQLKEMTKETKVEELTAEEKQRLDANIRSFLESNEQIKVDNNPKKIEYCFESLKRIFKLNSDPDSCMKKLEYYKDLVIQRDKEISLLIDLIKKERKKGKEGSIEEKLEGNLKVIENSSSLSNFDKIQVNKECNGQGDHSPKVFTETDDRMSSMINNILKNTVPPKKHKARPKINKSLHQRNLMTNLDQNIDTSSNKSISNDVPKQNSLPCNIINLTLNNSTETDETNQQSFRKKERKKVKPGEIEASKKKAIEIKQNAESSSVRIEPEKIEVPVLETNNVKPYYQRFLSFNVPKNSNNSMTDNLTERKSIDQTVETKNQNKINSNEQCKVSKLNSEENSNYKPSLDLKLNLESTVSQRQEQLTDRIRKCLNVDHLMSSRSIGVNSRDIDVGLNQQRNAESLENEAKESHKQSTRSNVCSFDKLDSNRRKTSEKRTSISSFTVDQPEKPYVFDEQRKEEVNQTLNYDGNKDFEGSLPLTGDPEIDEEIIAFYKAKRSGGTY
ncbi:kinesin-like protein KIF6 [Osmia bicornis bicornis]|uniref:kinesin-like protein KIF6 n=1 Tax=Osmia bicornis bicornis TaxID=1437191 RepID=UPI001EAE923A|nr:kinesin-like protein KIF6 [Osmia bicornis bicornis]